MVGNVKKLAQTEVMKTIEQAMEGRRLGDHKNAPGLSKEEMREIFQAFSKATLSPAQRRETLEQVRDKYPALYVAMSFYRNPDEAFEIGYLAQSRGAIEQTDAPENATAKEVMQAAAERATAYAKTFGYEEVFYEDGRILLRSPGNPAPQPQIIPVSADKGGMLSILFKPKLKSVELVTREICQHLNKMHFTAGMPIPTRFEIDPTAQGYDPRNVFWAAMTAKLSYMPRSQIASITQSWGLERLEFIHHEATDSQAYLAENKDILVIGARGTQEITDVKTDADCGTVPFDGPVVHGNIHEGFNRALEGLWGQIEPGLKGLLDNGKPIIISGHSLGGSLAAGIAAKLLNAGVAPSRIRLYTFGQPRTFNTPAADLLTQALGERYLRVVHHNDEVPRHLPPPYGPNDYSHGGQQYFLGGDGTLVKNPSHTSRQLNRIAYRASQFSDNRVEVEGLMDKIGYTVKHTILDGFMDHYIDDYVVAIAMNMHRYDLRLDRDDVPGLAVLQDPPEA